MTNEHEQRRYPFTVDGVVVSSAEFLAGIADRSKVGA